MQQSLAARLDRLGEAREAAQIGSVLGREFSYPLLKSVADLSELSLQASLDRLAEADLLFVEGGAPTATFRIEKVPDGPYHGPAHRAIGVTGWHAGDFAGARGHLEEALKRFNPGHDEELALHFGQDPDVAAMAYLALTLRPLGESDRTAGLSDELIARIRHISHGASIAYGYMHAFCLELLRANFSRAAVCAEGMARAVKCHDMDHWRVWGMFPFAWAKRQTGGRAEGLNEMRRCLPLLREHNLNALSTILRVELARAEMEDGLFAEALATIEEATQIADRCGQRWYLAEIARLRGEVLSRQTAPDNDKAEQSLLNAIAIANQQGARGFCLRAALSLAKVYQSNNRAVDMHDVLAPALKGFAPAPDMPEIAEALALLSASPRIS